jgi:NAD-dependent DNA ligase
MATASRLTASDEAVLKEAAELGLFTEFFSGKHVALSGALSMSRTDVISVITAVGGHWDPAVRSSTDFLVVGDTKAHGMTNKINKAMEMGVTVLEEHEFVARLSVV